MKPLPTTRPILTKANKMKIYLDQQINRSSNYEKQLKIKIKFEFIEIQTNQSEFQPVTNIEIDEAKKRIAIDR